MRSGSREPTSSGNSTDRSPDLPFWCDRVLSACELSLHRDVLQLRIPLLERLVDDLAAVLTRVGVNEAVHGREQLWIECHTHLHPVHAT